MKKIFLPLTLLLGACSNSGTSSTAADPASAAVQTADTVELAAAEPARRGGCGVGSHVGSE